MMSGFTAGSEAQRASLNRITAALLFFVACPVMIGFPMGWYQAGLGRFMSPAASCGLWVSQWLISWWLSELLLQIGIVVLRPWRVPFTALVVLASLGNMLLARFHSPALVALFTALSGSTIPQAFAVTDRSLLNPSYFNQLVRSSIYGVLYWSVLRLVYERYRQRPDWPELSDATRPAERDVPVWPVAETPAPPLPAELPPSRLTAELRKNGMADPAGILAVQAEDHYIRVHLLGGSRLILYRFADALADLRDLDGIQVHRSFWVRRDAIAGVHRERGAVRLSLTSGLSVPVSQKHHALLGYLLDRHDS